MFHNLAFQWQEVNSTPRYSVVIFTSQWAPGALTTMWKVIALLASSSLP